MKKKISPLKTELDYQCLLINSPKALAEYQKSEVEEEKVVKEGNICAFYPRYVKKIKKENEFCLKEVCKINKHNKNEVTDLLEYIQIGNLKENEIKGKLKTDSKT